MSRRSPAERNGCPFQYSCLGKPKNRGAWWATVYGVTKSQTYEQLTLSHIKQITNKDLLNSTESSPVQENPYFPFVFVQVTQSCLTLCDPMDYTVHGILQARILEWLAFPFSRGSSQPRDQTQVSLIAGGFFTS